MNARFNNIEDMCPREEIFAYLDGELNSDDELKLEFHLSECKTCMDETNAQKKVSNSLEIILEEEMKNIVLPENFTEVVKAKAEGHVNGLRQRKEISRALVICMILSAIVIFGFGAGKDSVWMTAEKLADQGAAVLGFVAHLIFDSFAGIALILRTLCHKFIFNSVLSIIVIVGFFVAAFLSLSRLVIRENRS